MNDSCITINPENLKQFSKSKKIKNFLDYINSTKKFSSEPFYNPDKTTLCFDMLDPDFEECVTKSVTAPLSDIVRIISRIYNIPEFTCSKDDKTIYYKNIRLKGFEFNGTGLAIFAEEDFDQDILTIGTKYPNLSIKIEGENIKISSNINDETYILREKKLIFCKFFKLDEKYGKFIKRICEDSVNESASGSFEEMSSFLSKDKKEFLQLIDDTYFCEDINRIDVIGTYRGSNYDLTYNKYVNTTDFALILNYIVEEDEFSNSPDGKHFYYESEEILNKNGIFNGVLHLDKGELVLPEGAAKEIQNKYTSSDISNEEIFEIMKKYNADEGFIFKDGDIFKEEDGIITYTKVLYVKDNGNLQLAETKELNIDNYGFKFDFEF